MGGVEDHNKILWVRWDIVCLPKDKGGLDVKNLEAFNISLLSKWRWKCLVGNSSLWFKILSQRYGDFAQWGDNTVSQGRIKKLSLWWRDIISIGEDFMKDASWFRRVTKLKLGEGG